MSGAHVHADTEARLAAIEARQNVLEAKHETLRQGHVNDIVELDGRLDLLESAPDPGPENPSPPDPPEEPTGEYGPRPFDEIDAPAIDVPSGGTQLTDWNQLHAGGTFWLAGDIDGPRGSRWVGRSLSLRGDPANRPVIKNVGDGNQYLYHPTGGTHTIANVILDGFMKESQPGWWGPIEGAAGSGWDATLNLLGVTVRNGKSTGIRTGDGPTTVVDCSVENQQYGLGGSGGPHRFYRNRSIGVTEANGWHDGNKWGGLRDSEIVGLYVRDCAGDGFWLDVNQRDNIISDLDIEDVGGRGIHLELTKGTGNKVSRFRVRHAGQAFIGTGASTGWHGQRQQGAALVIHNAANQEVSFGTVYAHPHYGAGIIFWDDSRTNDGYLTEGNYVHDLRIIVEDVELDTSERGWLLGFYDRAQIRDNRIERVELTIPAGTLQFPYCRLPGVGDCTIARFREAFPGVSVVEA